MMIRIEGEIKYNEGFFTFDGRLLLPSDEEGFLIRELRHIRNYLEERLLFT